MQKVIYNPETGGIEDYPQCVVVLVPEGMDGEQLEEALNVEVGDFEFETQHIVTWEDTVDALILAARAEGIDGLTLARIIATMRDAVDNND